jgi:cytochrome c-type biogenesis protein CcsB
MIGFTLRVALLGYLGAAVAALLALSGRQNLPRRLLGLCLRFGALVLAVSIGLRCIDEGTGAIASFDAGLALLGLLVVVVFLAAERRRPVAALGIVVAPLAFALTLAADLVYEGAHPVPPALHSVWLPIHVVLALLGDAVFAIAFSASLLYLFQERRLKSHRIRGWLPQLPSLETLDRLNYTCLVWGLLLLTLGIVSGVVWAHSAWGGAWTSDPKLLLSLAVWVIYLVLLLGRMTVGWRGRWAAQLTMAGFAVIVLSLVGVNALGLGNHGRLF